MKKEFLELGKIVSTHGLNGTLRVQPWCDGIDFAKQFKNVYLGNKKEKTEVELCTQKGNVFLMKLACSNSIEEAQALKNTVIYIKRDDVHLSEDSYFIQELIGCRVVDFFDNQKVYGTLTDVYETGANDVWCVHADKDYLIPSIPDVVKDVDINSGIIKITPLKGIFDEEINGDED